MQSGAVIAITAGRPTRISATTLLQFECHGHRRDQRHVGTRETEPPRGKTPQPGRFAGAMGACSGSEVTRAWLVALYRASTEECPTFTSVLPVLGSYGCRT